MVQNLETMDAMDAMDAMAKQAKKKHQKEVERKVNRAQRRAAVFGTGRPRTYATQSLAGNHHDSSFDVSIGAYAVRIEVPFFRAAFELSYPMFGPARDVEHVWNLARVEKLDTESLVAELRNLGVLSVDTEREVFRQETAAYRSAIMFASEVWVARLSSSADGHARDLVRLAAHALWKRWNEDRPSREMAIEALLFMRQCIHRSNGVGVVTWGLRFWDFVAPELTPDVRTLDMLEERLDAGRGVDLADQIADLAAVAGEVAGENIELGRKLLLMFVTFAHQFPGEAPEWHDGRVEETARLLYGVGEVERAESMLREHITAHPHHAGGYMTLAECWMFGNEGDKRRALALLEEAEALPVKDGRECDLDQRIEMLVTAIEKEERDRSSGAPKETKKSTQRLVRLMKLAYEDVHDDVIEEIGARGDEAVGFLKNVLADPWVWSAQAYDDGATLRNAFRALGAVGTDLARQTLREIMSQHKDAEVPKEARSALERCARNTVTE